MVIELRCTVQLANIDRQIMMSNTNGKKTMSEKKKKRDDEPIAEIALPIEWRISPDISSRYVNHCLIQWGEHECKISLFELEPPLIVGTEEQKREQAKKLTSITANCVGRIILARDFVPKLITILQQTSEKSLIRDQDASVKAIGVHDERKKITGS